MPEIQFKVNVPDRVGQDLQDMATERQCSVKEMVIYLIKNDLRMWRMSKATELAETTASDGLEDIS